MTNIFIYFLEEVIERLNKVPDKNLIAFLDLLGLKLLPALPARAPITFKLTDGTPDHVLIQEGSQIAANNIIFETEENMLASPAKLMAAFSVDVTADTIYKSPVNVFSGQSNMNFQTKLCYSTKMNDIEIFVDETEGLNEGDTLKIGDSEYTIVSKVSDDKVTLKSNLLKAHDSGVDVKKITYFELFRGKNLQEHILYLGHNDLFNLKKGILKKENGTDCHVHLNILFEGLSDWQIYEREKLGSLKWEYWNGNKWQNLKHYDKKTDFTKESVKISLKKSNITPSQKRDNNGINTFWIRCIGSIDHTRLPLLEGISLSIDILNGPDMCFYNDIPVNLEANTFLPFGKTPKIYDVFYIASQECFSKKSEKISLTFTLTSPVTPRNNLILSWEYWNGKSWMAIEDLKPSNYLFSNSNTVNFTCPQDIEPNEVNGTKNYWLRVKILNGEYGNITNCTKSDSCPHKNETDNYFTLDEIKPPEIKSIQITVKNSEKRNLNNSLTFNTLEFKDITTASKINNSKTFKLFNPLEDNEETIYLGFDQRLEKGPISLFLSIEDYPWIENDLPRIKWYYYDKNDEWVILDNIDNTKGFTRTDTIQFVFPPDLKKTRKFGENLFWIKAVDVNRKLKITGDNEEKSPNKLKKDDMGEENIEPCPGLMELFNPEWNYSESPQKNFIGPLIHGIYLNTIWGVQWENVNEEILGSSDGTAFQKFITLKNPIISEEVWVNEFNTILDVDMENISGDKDFKVKEVRDLNGNLIEFWVRWNTKDDLLFASDDRCYEIDQYSGELKFGDGKHGRIPPIGKENIKINYHTGGGSKGNLSANEIKALKSTIAFVDKAYNPIPSEGGSDVESIEELTERGPQRLKNRNRAVTVEDYEEVTKEVSQAIARVKCLANFDAEGKNNPGHVTTLVIPHSINDKPELSLELKKQIKTYLNDHSPNTMTLEVRDPVYVGVSVNLTLMAVTASSVPVVEKTAYQDLKKFLNPLTGGFKGKGWPFGRMPCISDFYNLLENTENVDRVKSISVTLKTNVGQEYVLTPEKNVEISLAPYSIIYSSIHNVNVGINMEDL